jgi:predicted ATPase
MIKKWKLFNFKSVADETTLEFSPLTLLAGPNSSGKSSCLQSMLLICQTLRNPISSRSVILNGALARLGQFSDLKTVDSAADQILIGWELKPTVPAAGVGEQYGLWEEEWIPYDLADGTDLTSLSCDVAFDAKSEIPNDSTQLNPQLFSTVLRGSFREEDGADHIASFGISRAIDAGEGNIDWLRKKGTSDENIDRVRSSTSYRVEMDKEAVEDMQGRYASAELVGAELVHFLPRRVSLVYNYAEDQIQSALRAIFPPRLPAISRSRMRHVVVPASALHLLANRLETVLSQDQDSFGELTKLLSGPTCPLPAIVDALRSLSSTKRRQVQEVLQGDPNLPDEFVAVARSEFGSEFRTLFYSPPPRIQAVSQYTRRYFSQAIKYLGPLRDEPKALYPLGNSADPFDVGLKGENTAAVLDLHKTRLVRFIPPSAFVGPAIQGDAITRTLQAATSEWLRYLSVAESVDSRDRGKLGHELKVRLDQAIGDQDLTHVGVGVSQVLPILVMCLLAEPDTVLLFEQPELHLHPKVQTLLGDFFLSMALTQKQCIIETHSEYLINRLRFRAAAAEAEKSVADKMTIYFVEKKDGKSHFRPIVVNEFGALEDWPEGFFDQSQREAEQTLKEAMKKRQMLRARKS